jgi:hypothetical protein
MRDMSSESAPWPGWQLLQPSLPPQVVHQCYRTYECALQPAGNGSCHYLVKDVTAMRCAWHLHPFKGSKLLFIMASTQHDRSFMKWGAL